MMDVFNPDDGLQTTGHYTNDTHFDYYIPYKKEQTVVQDMVEPPVPPIKPPGTFPLVEQVGTFPVVDRIGTFPVFDRIGTFPLSSSKGRSYKMSKSIGFQVNGVRLFIYIYIVKKAFFYLYLKRAAHLAINVSLPCVP